MTISKRGTIQADKQNVSRLSSTDIQARLKKAQETIRSKATSRSATAATVPAATPQPSSAPVATAGLRAAPVLPVSTDRTSSGGLFPSRYSRAMNKTATMNTNPLTGGLSRAGVQGINLRQTAGTATPEEIGMVNKLHASASADAAQRESMTKGIGSIFGGMGFRSAPVKAEEAEYSASSAGKHEEFLKTVNQALKTGGVGIIDITDGVSEAELEKLRRALPSKARKYLEKYGVEALYQSFEN